MKKYPRVFAVAVILAATLFVYAPGLRNGFVWDDTALVLRDPLIRSWRLIPEAFGHFLFLDATASNFYRPLQRLTFTADYALYGFAAPWGWHLTSILAHAGAALAFWALARRFLSAGWALGLGVLWAIHPVHTSAVTYVAGRADPLAACFGFAALALGLASLERPRLVLAAGACFLGAMLSKESGVGFLLVWLLVLAWRRVGWRASGKSALCLVVVLGSYSALRFSAQRTPPPAPPQTPVSIRPILAARALAEYAGLVVLPRTLRMERDVTTAPQQDYESTLRNAERREYGTLLGVLIAVGLGLWWRWAWQRERDAALWLTAAGLAWLPVSNLFSLNATVAEHWIYVPSAFLFLAAGLSLRRAIDVRCSTLGVRCSESASTAEPTSNVEPRTPNLEHSLLLVARGVFVGWLLFLGARTWLRQADWRDQRTFLERTIAAGGDSARMRMNLGNLEFSEGRIEAALKQYDIALKAAPDQAMAWLALAQVSLRIGDLPRAREALAKADKNDFLAADTLVTRAALAQRESGADPTEALARAVELRPHSWPLRRRYLTHLDQTGRTVDAARALRAFLEREDFRAESWLLLADFLAKLRQPEAAAIARREAMLRDVRVKAG